MTGGGRLEEKKNRCALHFSETFINNGAHVPLLPTRAPPPPTTTMADALRKPLFPAETAGPPATVAVTGASGYLAGTVVRRLLAAGHTVHGTVRDPANAAKVAHLWAMPGAKDRLKLFKVREREGMERERMAAAARNCARAFPLTPRPLSSPSPLLSQADLTDAAAFDAPLAGCTAAIHTASPVIMAPPPGRERELLLDPAVKGTEAVLAAATRAGSVKKVVVTSSVAAVFSDAWEKGRDHTVTAADWNEVATETFHPYHRAKTLAERAAWAAAAGPGKGKWALATIVPPVILGPPPGNVKCEVVGLARRMLGGAMFPATAPVGMGIVDVEDCAAAHTLAALIPSATGRYIVCGAETTLLGYAAKLRPEYGMYKYERERFLFDFFGWGREETAGGGAFFSLFFLAVQPRRTHTSSLSAPPLPQAPPLRPARLDPVAGLAPGRARRRALPPHRPVRPGQGAPL